MHITLKDDESRVEALSAGSTTYRLFMPYSSETLSDPEVIKHFSCSSQLNITKTCLYNFDPLKPYFYIVELGFPWVYIMFLIFA